jgi:hypothetical protein
MRTCKQLAKVIASDVLDDPSASFKGHPAPIHSMDADHVIANRPLSESSWTIEVRRHDSSQCRLMSLRYINGQSLSLTLQNILQRLHGDSSFDGNR